MSTRIGELLETAGLVSSAQIDVAIRDQVQFPDKRLGEILALRGWVKSETIDFFVYLWPQILDQPTHYPLGYYLKASALLNESQITALLKEQSSTGVKFGALAVLHGWLKPDTITFFLQGLNPQALSASAFVDKHAPLSAQTQPAPLTPTRKQGPVTPTPLGDDLDSDVAWIG